MEMLAGVFVMLVTAIGGLAPNANIPTVLGVSTQTNDIAITTLAETRLNTSSPEAASRQEKSEILQNAIKRRELAKQNLESRRAEIAKKIADRKLELKEKLAEVKDARKRTIVSNLGENLNNKNQRFVTHWNSVLDRLTEILAKVEERSIRAKEAGKDTASVLTAIATAKTAIADAQSAVNNQEAKVYTINITSEEKLRADVQSVLEQFKADMRTVHSSITKARQAVQTAIRSLATLFPEELAQ